MSKIFEESFEYKLIYVFAISDNLHKGLLKIGDATIQTDSLIDTLAPNSSLLNQAAKKRIDQYTKTAAISYQLLHTELAIRTVKDEDGKLEIKAFRDHDVHRVLINSGFGKKEFGESKGREWFELDLATVLMAIEAVKRSRPNLSRTYNLEDYSPIIFRPEQEHAISQTLKQFKTGNRMLWNAKMRFGKTLCALEVIRQSEFAKTIIITHRPVVDDGWYQDFKNIFYDRGDYEYGSKNNGATVEYLLKNGKKFVYFASMQDLRDSSTVGGKYNKNNMVFSTDWDCVVVDEAHEGTTTSLGENVIKYVVKENNGHETKLIALSGTPFNILSEYEDNIYTWDYIMEQQSKSGWDTIHFGDSNPYDELPEMRIYTYDIGKIIFGKRYVELEDKAFNFREFFRVWTGDIRYDRIQMPADCEAGDFYHANDVRSFLDLITKADEDSQYPYSTNEYRELFKHSLWMVPGVQEAKALSKMMKNHPVFGSGAFDFVNVAGDGDEEEKSEDALKKVRSAIETAGENYTITFSCGKLTTGVTVSEWTTVFMLAGSFSTSAANYLQTIFRVQSPCNKNGKIKHCCYVFDFAPDRTLKMVAEAVALSTKAGKASESDKSIMGEFLNYCPVISIDGTMMKPYDTNKLLQQLKRAYAERAVKNGFDDNNLYNDELLKLNGVAIEEFEDLKKIVGASKAAAKINDIDINDQGFTDEEYEEIGRISKKPKAHRTPEEEERIEELKEKKKQKNDAISILRGVSIRMPLLIYGADIAFNEDFTIDKFLDDKIVDPASWDEFMPSGVTKQVFRRFIKYYDAEIFVAAGRRIRNTVKSADEMPPTERIQKIANLFSCFKNPDKETVLTPWRVVNMHMGDCLGGYDFYDEEHNTLIENPRYVDHGKVTADTLSNAKAQILEINSKTGLYPLYVAYSIFRSRCAAYAEEELTYELQARLWNRTVHNNVFVICKTPMAESITRRTLVGYRNVTVNTHYIDDLIHMMQNDPKLFVERVLKESYWKKKGGSMMKFNAIVGNPPYQLSGGSGGTNDAPIYQHFASTAEQLNSQYVSLIIPARWFAGGREQLLGDFRKNMLTNKNIQKLYAFANSNYVFPSVDIKGGICYYLLDKAYSGDCAYSLVHDKNKEKSRRDLGVFDILIREPKLSFIVQTVRDATTIGKTVDTIISSDTPFGIPTNPATSKNSPFPVHSSPGEGHDTLLYFLDHLTRKIAYTQRSAISKNAIDIDKFKVLLPKAAGSGSDSYVIGKPEFAPRNSVCSQTFLYAAFDSEIQAKNFISYLQTKFFRALVAACKISQEAPSKVYRFVPLQDFTKSWNDDELYKMYGLTEENIEFIESRISSLE